MRLGAPYQNNESYDLIMHMARFSIFLFGDKRRQLTSD